jgi:hypothetical protein
MTVNPNKTGLAAFTKKRKRQGFFELYFFGARLILSGSVKYLGVTLDSGLTWREHVEVKVKKTRNLLWACRRAGGVGGDWDPGWSAGATSPSFGRQSPLNP